MGVLILRATHYDIGRRWYQELASELGCKHYYRSESLNIDQTFIESLSEIVSESEKVESGNIRQKICPATFKQCDQELR